jgi:type IV pilus assembly protein PilX
MKPSIPLRREPGVRGRGSRQSGASLVFALITLVALALAATALVRSVDTGAIVLGNLGSRQATTAAADKATQRAIIWLSTAADLTQDSAAAGYFATSLDGYDLTGFQGSDPMRGLVNWEVDGTCAYATSGNCVGTTTPSPPITIDASTTARYLITRLCKTTGDYSAAGQVCASPPKLKERANERRGQVNYSQQSQTMSSPVPYYRIVVRVVGPRNATSFTETIVNL